VGRCLLSDPHAAADGLQALQAHNADGLASWKQYLGIS